MTTWRTHMEEDRPSENGHDRGLAVLSRRTRPALQRYFERRGFLPQDAEDAVQDVFLRLSRRAEALVSPQVEAYLFETAASVAIDRYRHARTRCAQQHTAYDEAQHAVVDHAVDQVVEARQTLHNLIESLHQLPERTRQVVLLARLERLTYPEIARRLGISVSTVERRLIKGMAHLAAHLQEAGR
jgi:RNA polymerase sigma factor (sigma-70 family)